MDILLVDAVNVFGNGYILPRGTLRESMSHISRADVCLITKIDQAEAGDEAYMLAKHLPNVPVLIGAERAVTGRYAIFIAGRNQH